MWLQEEAMITECPKIGLGKSWLTREPGSYSTLTLSKIKDGPPPELEEKV